MSSQKSFETLNVEWEGKGRHRPNSICPIPDVFKGVIVEVRGNLRDCSVIDSFWEY